MDHNNIKPERIFFSQALVKIDGLFFRTRGGGREGWWDTGYGTDHACEGCFHPPRGEAVGAGGGSGGGRYTFGTPALYIAEKPDLPGNKNFFLHPSRLPPSLSAPSTCNPLLRPPCHPPPPRSSYAPFVKHHHLRPFYLSVHPLALYRNNVDSRLTSFADTRASAKKRK